MDIANRDALLEELAQQLQDTCFHRVHLGVIKVTLFEGGEELCEFGLDGALNQLACNLWQAGDGTDISGATSLEVDTY